MAKYTRHDPCNKKRNKHKSQSKAGHQPKVRKIAEHPLVAATTQGHNT